MKFPGAPPPLPPARPADVGGTNPREGAASRTTAAEVKSEPGPPMTLGSAAAAGVRLIVWFWDCRHQDEPDPAKMVQRYGAELPAPPELRDRLCVPRGRWAQSDGRP
jgi:hypothetical protein